MSRFDFEVSRPLYPLLAVASSFAVLLVGLFLSDTPLFLWIIVWSCLLCLAFGYGRILLGFMVVCVPLGAAIAATSLLTGATMDAAFRTLGRIMIVGIAAVPAAGTPPVNLTRSLSELHVPRSITLGMLVTIRFVPLLVAEVRRIREAMRTRGVNMAWYNPGCIYRAFLIPFAMRLVNISDSLAVSVETRGFDTTVRDSTVYRRVDPSVRDAVYLLALAAGCIVAIVLI